MELLRILKVRLLQCSINQKYVIPRIEEQRTEQRQRTWYNNINISKEIFEKEMERKRQPAVYFF